MTRPDKPDPILSCNYLFIPPHQAPKNIKDILAPAAPASPAGAGNAVGNPFDGLLPSPLSAAFLFHSRADNDRRACYGLYVQRTHQLHVILVHPYPQCLHLSLPLLLPVLGVCN